MSHGIHLDLDTLLVHQEFVKRLARALVHDRSLADDLAQDAYLSAFRYTEQRDGRIASPRGLLGAIVWRLARRGGRKEHTRTKRESLADAPRPESSPEEIAQRESVRRCVLEAVLALEEPYRKTVIARYLDDLGPAEIAARDKVPVETVRTRLKRASSQLRDRLDGECGGGRWRMALLPLAEPTIASISSFGFSGAGLGAKIGVVATLAAGTAVFALHRSNGTGDPANPIPSTPHVLSASSSASSAAGVIPIVEPAPRVAIDSQDPSVPRTSDRGRILDESGVPIVGATITVVHEIGEDRGAPIHRRGIATTTDDLGAFEVAREATEVRDGKKIRRRLEIVAPGFAVKRPHVRYEGDPRSGYGDIVLERGGTLRGVVLDQDDRPVSGIRLAAGDDRSSAPSWRQGIHNFGDGFAVTRSDERGGFEFSGLALGWARVFALGDQGVVFATERLAVQRGDDSPAVTLRIRRFANEEKIVVTVFGVDGREVPGASIRHHYRKETKGGWLGATIDTVADPTGRYEYFTDDGETHALATIRDGRIVAAAYDVRMPGTQVGLRETPARTVKVIVRDDSAVRRTDAEVRVYVKHDEAGALEERFVATRADDGFRFDALLGTISIDVSCPGFGSTAIAPIAATDLATELIVDLVRTHGIHGVVRSRGEPIPGAMVELLERADDTDCGLVISWRRSHGKDGAVSSRSDERGAYSISPPRKGRYRLRVSQDGFAPTTLEAFDFDPRERTVVLDATLGEGGEIVGRVVREDSESAAGLEVRACAGDDLVLESRVDAEGRYRFERVAAGEYEVNVRLERGRSSSTGSARDTEELPKREVRARVTEGEVARCDLTIPIAATAGTRIEGRIRLGTIALSDCTANLLGAPRESLESMTSLRLREHLRRGARIVPFTTIGPDGSFAMVCHAMGDAWIEVRPQNTSGATAHYVLPVKLTGGTVSAALEVEVGTVVVRASGTMAEPPNHAQLIWRGRAGSMAIFNSTRADDGSYRFDRVPEGEVEVEIGGSSVSAVARANETVVVDAE